MEILHAIPELGAIDGPIVLSVGVFDGVHPGHCAVLKNALEHAREIGGTAVALTFDPHPARVLRPERAPRLLTSTPHKARLIAAAGISHLLLVTFNAEFAATPAERFIRELAGAAKLRRICVGKNWMFGRGREGNPALLRRLGDELGFDVCETPAVQVDGAPVSSTRIREAVERGDLDLVRRLLGRDYSVLGTVEAGDRLGRAIGFPTANLRAHNEQFPPNGVYAVRVDFDGEILGGVANIGVRPTIEAATPDRRLEVHLFDFANDIYGRDLDVDFVKFIRGEQKFDGIDALKTQIARDVKTARAILGN